MFYIRQIMRRIIIFQNTSLLTQDTSQFIFCSNALDYDDKMYSPFYVYSDSMMTSSNGTIFRFTCPLWGETTVDRWIPLTKASDAELWCFIWSAPEQTFEQTIGTPVIWDAIVPIMTSLISQMPLLSPEEI